MDFDQLQQLFREHHNDPTSETFKQCFNENFDVLRDMFQQKNFDPLANLVCCLESYLEVNRYFIRFFKKIGATNEMVKEFVRYDNYHAISHISNSYLLLLFMSYLDDDEYLNAMTQIEYIKIHGIGAIAILLKKLSKTCDKEDFIKYCDAIIPKFWRPDELRILRKIRNNAEDTSVLTKTAR